jgi:hypothetical protein
MVEGDPGYICYLPKALKGVAQIQTTLTSALSNHDSPECCCHKNIRFQFATFSRLCAGQRRVVGQAGYGIKHDRFKIMGKVHFRGRSISAEANPLTVPVFGGLHPRSGLYSLVYRKLTTRH